MPAPRGEGKIMDRTAVRFAAALIAVSSYGQEAVNARTYLNQGVRAYKDAKYLQAADFFQRAVELDPNSKTAHLYLATAYMSQFIPGADSPENIRLAESAHEGFRAVLKLDPNDELATASIASLYFNQKKLDEAREWNQRLVVINPQNKGAYYTLGVIAWMQWLAPDREARLQSEMKVEDPGPLKVDSVREELKAKYLPILDAGIANMEKALALDKEYDEAMAYMNLLIRYRADLLSTPEEYKQQIEVAEGWIQKALGTKKIKAERARGQ
jgi:Tfp pilus assembly protein PilF